MDRNVGSIVELIENYKSNDLPAEQNKYAALYSELNPYLTPFEMIGDEQMSGIMNEKTVFSDINTIVDNLEEMYSSVFHSNAIRNRRFVIQKYNTSLTKLDTIDEEWNQICISKNVTDLIPACDVLLAYYINKFNCEIIKNDEFYSCNYKGYSWNNTYRCCAYKIKIEDVISCHHMSLTEFDEYTNILK